MLLSTCGAQKDQQQDNGRGAAVKTRTNSLQIRLKILMRRESLVWLIRRGVAGVVCGWLLNCKDDAVLFKDRKQRGAQRISIDQIKSCGVV